MTARNHCPICDVPVAPPVRDVAPGAPPPPKSYYPFCSDRCRMVDLGRWLTGQYAIPGDTVRSPEDEDPNRRG
jgi:uncharacterized protein